MMHLLGPVITTHAGQRRPAHRPSWQEPPDQSMQRPTDTPQDQHGAMQAAVEPPPPVAPRAGEAPAIGLIRQWLELSELERRAFDAWRAN
ncbi:MAG: hypothetical protein WDN04_25315 [Rhodospirillales bacterium]